MVNNINKRRSYRKKKYDGGDVTISPIKRSRSIFTTPVKTLESSPPRKLNPSTPRTHIRSRSMISNSFSPLKPNRKRSRSRSIIGNSFSPRKLRFSPTKPSLKRFKPNKLRLSPTKPSLKRFRPMKLRLSPTKPKKRKGLNYIGTNFSWI